MAIYILQDSDWDYGDKEYPGIIVEADSIEEAIKKATDQAVLEDPHDGGITWKIAEIVTTAFCIRTWSDGVVDESDKVLMVEKQS